MEIIVGELSGFCFGVQRAIEKVQELVEKEKNIYCLGELVHNKQVIEELEKKGLITINDIEKVPEKTKLIIRAHGVSPKIYKIIKQKNIELIDCTCPKVLKIHELVNEAKNNNYIFIIGHKDHPEIVGTKGFCGTNSFIIEKVEQITEAINKFKESKMKNVYIISQTTFSTEEFEKIVKEIKNQLQDSRIEVNNSICSATYLRQKEVGKISKKVDYMLVIGGKNSSNTRKLFEIADRNCKSEHIQTEDDIDFKTITKYNKIGIVAGASTPKNIINKVENVIKNYETRKI